MKAPYTVEVKNGITYIHIYHPVDLELSLRIIDDVSSHYPYQRRIYIFNNNWTVETTEVTKVAEYGKRKFTQKNKSAFVCNQDRNFGMFRMLEVYREDGLINSHVFRNIEEALEWLKK